MSRLTSVEGTAGDSQSTPLSSHPLDEFCLDPKCRVCYAPPCPKCQGKGALFALNPRGYATLTCPACGGCGAQI